MIWGCMNIYVVEVLNWRWISNWWLLLEEVYNEEVYVVLDW